jgi:hypothetical protein
MSAKEVFGDRTVIYDFKLKRSESDSRGAGQEREAVIWRQCKQVSIVYDVGFGWKFGVACDEVWGSLYLISARWEATKGDSCLIEIYEVPKGTHPSPSGPEFDATGRLLSNTKGTPQPLATVTQAFPARITKITTVRSKVKNDRLSFSLGLAFLSPATEGTQRFDFDLKNKRFLPLGDSE